jgi:hypothetical protein
LAVKYAKLIFKSKQSLKNYKLLPLVYVLIGSLAEITGNSQMKLIRLVRDLGQAPKIFE